MEDEHTAQFITSFTKREKILKRFFFNFIKMSKYHYIELTYNGTK